MTHQYLESSLCINVKYVFAVTKCFETSTELKVFKLAFCMMVFHVGLHIGQDTGWVWVCIHMHL